MYLFGDLFSDYDSTLSSPSGALGMNNIVLSNGVYDSMLLSSDPTNYGKYSIDAWNAATAIYARFNGTLTGGNIDYQLSTIQSIRLKRREFGTNAWMTIFEKQVSTKDDLSFAFIDSFAKGNNTHYEYCAVPVVNSVEQSMDIVQIMSNFDGAIITDGVTSYHVLLDVSISGLTRNRQSGTIVTLNSRYPFVFYGGNANYDTGNFAATVLKIDPSTDYVDIAGSIKYCKEMTEWLTNGSTKILKHFDGREWIIQVNGNVTSDASEHPDKVKLSFDFIETGNIESSTDMYENGFINVNVEGS